MDGLTSKTNGADKNMTKKEKAAIKKLEKDKQKKEKEKLKQEKLAQKQKEKEDKVNKKKGSTVPAADFRLAMSTGSTPTTIASNPEVRRATAPPEAMSDPIIRSKVLSSDNHLPTQNNTPSPPRPLKRGASGAALPTPESKETPLDSAPGGLLGAKVKRRRPRKFKEKEFNQILESIRSGSFTGDVLDLSNRYLDKWAAGDLAKVLASNSTVTELNISNNEIGDDGVVPLSRMLEKNKTIRILDVQFNMLTRKGTKHLLTCLNNNVFITELYMDEREVNLGDMFVNTDTALEAIGSDVRERIDKLVKSNKNFQLLLEGKSNSLELPDRSQSYVNTHILERFPELGNIDLRKNKLRFIPEEIGLLKKLEQLLLSDNRIEKLPNQIGELPNLRVLDLANNCLSELPLALTTLPRLKHLNLQQNKFNDLPRFSLGSMKSLVTLDIRGNPLAQMSCMGSSFMDVVAQGGRETLSFLRENNKGMAEVYRMKIMFVGNGNVGKTTLLSHFLKQKTKLPAGGHVSAAAAIRDQNGSNGPKSPAGSQIRTPKVPKTLENVATDGIDIHKWNYRHPGKSYVSKAGSEALNDDDLKEKYINFSCWDFAGQEVYYATHSFFLSQRAIYILVFNLLEPEETNQIEYWLQSINSRTENSPIIMVGTHAEDKRCTQEYIKLYFEKIMEKYGQRFRNHIVSMHAISNIEKNSGVPDLKEKIVRVALNQDYMPDRIALSFLALEEKLMGAQQTLNPPTLNFADYSSMALDCNISESNILTATKFLNDLGSLVYFSDKDEGLNDLVVVDPQWITKTFATVVSLKFGFIRDGIMRVSDLPHIWAPPNYPQELHPKLVAMLEKLGIISRLKHEGEDKILIPCLLPENPPAATVMDEVWPAFEDTAQAGRVYSFEFVPLGFFSRLIVRFLISHYVPIVYWKRGIVLKKDSEKIRLTIAKDSKIKNFPMTMELWVRGPSPGRHLEDLVDNIDTLVDDWLRVKFERSVPCVHCIKEGSQDPYLFPLRVVEQSVTDGLKTVRCRGITEVPIALIAPDVTMAEFKGSVVALSDIQKGKMIGEGGFAKVYKAIWNNKVIALKELTLDTSSTAEAIGFEFEEATDPIAVFAEFRKEVSLMGNMRHPNIVGLLGLCMDPFCMLLEFCGLGCLFDYIHDVANKVLNWPVAVKLATDIARGMNFMHTYTPPLIHRDLKSPNVLLAVEPDQSGTPQIVAKVADFGLSRKLLLAGQLNLKVVDNPVWLAPEMMRKEDYDEKVDVYSYGVILWELVARKEFLGHISFLSAIEDAVLKGERPDIPTACIELFPEFAELIRKCWHDKPKERPDFRTCLQVLDMVQKQRLPRVSDKMPSFHLEVVAPEAVRAEKNEPEKPKMPAAQPQESDRTTTSVPITKHRLPRKTDQMALAKEEDNEPRAAPEVLAIVHGGDRTTKTLLPFARGRGRPPSSGPRQLPGPPRSLPPKPGPPGGRDRTSSWQQGVKSNMRVVGDGGDVQVSSFERVLESVGAPITTIVTFGERIWTSTAAGRTVIWDTKNASKIKEFTAHTQTVTAMLLVLQKEVWTTSPEGNLKIWNSEGEEIGELPIKAAGFSLLEDPNTHLIWVGCNVTNTAKKQPPEFGAIQVWDPSTRKLKKSWRVDPFLLPGDVNPVSPIPRCMLYHMNHVFVGSGPRILCYESGSFQAQGYMEDHTKDVNVLVSLGDEIWSASKDKLVKVWNPKENGSDCIATMEGHGGEVLGLCGDESGHVWSCGWDKKIFVWDAGEVKRFISFLPTQHTKSISVLHLTSCMEAGKSVRKIWAGSVDGTIGLWRLATFVKLG